MNLKPRIPREPRGVKIREHDGTANREHLAFVRQLPCLSCGAAAPNDSHHVGGLAHGKAMALRVNDRWTIPLCRRCHEHVTFTDRHYLADTGIDERAVARQLWKCGQIGGDVEDGIAIVIKAQFNGRARTFEGDLQWRVTSTKCHS